MRVLVTGGTGYIGSHICVDLLEQGHEVVVVDNLVNSHYDVMIRIKRITNKVPLFYHIDLRDTKSMKKIFNETKLEAIIHLAGLKSVNESILEPLTYYENNLASTVNLLNFAYNYNIKNIIFSSSAAVYGNPEKLPIIEDSFLCPINPYGRTKLFIEEILKDYQNINSDCSITILRYFNPIGAHPSGLIGELSPTEVSNNLVPYITKVASGELKKLYVYGNDYDTIDGTGVRDYIHVCDLAQGHLLALNNKFNDPGVHIYNLGTGKGYSVLQVIKTFSEVSNLNIKYVITNRRPGDIAICYADPSKANKELGFKTNYDLKDMCRDAWNWKFK